MNTIKTLPNDDIRIIMWRFDQRYDLQMLMHSARNVARGIVAQKVANGQRNTHEWNKDKEEILRAFDESGMTTFFVDTKYGGFIEGPKNMAAAIVAFELSWVDGGAATCSLAGNLALEPIHERGTEEQKQVYMSGVIPPKPEENRTHLRGAFVLTEPLPFVGVETGLLCGKVRIAQWEVGKEPILEVEKRGRFITNMDFANYVCVAVDTDDSRISSSCMIILQEDDPGIFDRGAPVKKIVHQLSSTRDPIFKMQVPASRIIGGYTIKDDKLIPNYSHSEIIEAVFKRTRVTVGVMSAAHVLSVVEPIIRYHRKRFHGSGIDVNNPRYQLGIQQKEDAQIRLLKIWAMGEAAASLGFAAARICDDYDISEQEKNLIFIQNGVSKKREQMKALLQRENAVISFLDVNKSVEPYPQDTLEKYVLVDALTNVLCPACKLWNTGEGVNVLREAVSLVGGYGLTEDCPGFLPFKWTDAQLEATYEGPEVVQRRQLSVTMVNNIFLKILEIWATELQAIHTSKPMFGALSISNAIRLWLWTMKFLQNNFDINGKKLYTTARQSICFPMVDAVCWILASRYQIMDVLELESKGKFNPVLQNDLDGYVSFFGNLCFLQAVQAALKVQQICTELYYGYRVNKDYKLEEEFKNICFEINHSFEGLDKAKQQGCDALTKIMISEVLDYPR